ncbi:TFIIB-type zinc ribbon-containing protein [Thermofilum pendens]|uniref:DNA-directed RNA polymerase subunit Rpo12 n=1 Tax=Thermofilum pendens (strain DSM 2475 / Hrk 5) TaxID=368408 RepID=A1RXI6_THEPD|nr:DNA-directed RNA polymerase subunit P [Thermofilum pendens]ABL77916.1 DNA-directed RNA polymerase, subunit P [Thermofilum pendens Hrk 5]
MARNVAHVVEADYSLKTYRCLRCGQVFTKEEQERLPGVRCPYCGFRIVEKVRLPVPKRVKAL